MKSVVVALIALVLAAVRPAPAPLRLVTDQTDEAAQLDLAKAKIEVAARRDATIRIDRSGRSLFATIVEPPAVPAAPRARSFALPALGNSLAVIVISTRSARGPPA